MSEDIGADLPVLQYSGAAAAFVLLAGFATVGVIAATPIPASAQCLLVGAMGLSMLRSYRVVARHRGRRTVRALRVSIDRGLDVRYGDGRAGTGRLREGCFVAPWLTIVRWRPDGARWDRSIVVLPDMLPAEDFRRLRVLLKWA